MARMQGVVVCAVLLAVLLSCTILQAQTGGTGQVVGTVTDPTGGVVVGATITLRDIATGSERAATTNEGGRYNFPNVAPGTYTLTVTKQGFRAMKFSEQQIVVGETRTFDAKLEIGSNTEIVEVVATNTELQTSSATVGNTITGVALNSLPTIQYNVP